MPKNYHLHLRGYVGGWNFDQEYTSYILDKYKDSEVNVLINSLGGDANSGLAINSLFKIHGNVHVHFVAMNASAATIAAMGAKRVTIDSGASFLVHKCLNAVCDWDWKNADQLEARIAELQKLKDDLNAIDSVVAGIYARKCKKTKDEMMALMKTGGWLTPQQALEWGFVDEITDLEEDEKPKLTEALASAICAAGMPMPPMKVEKDSFMDRLRRFFQAESADLDNNLDNLYKSASKSVTSQQPDNHTNPQPETMKKFAMLATLFGEAIALADSKAELTEAQLDKIEDSLSAKDTEIKTLKAQIAEKDKSISDLNATVEDLKKAPAEDTKDVKETSASMDTDGPGDDIDSVVAELANAFCS